MSQMLKPLTAARKLGVLLQATPEEFQGRDISREELAELQTNPPEWLTELRRNGPHPRQEVARRLGVSTSGLARAGATEPLTTAEIQARLEAAAERPRAARAAHAHVRRGQAPRGAGPAQGAAAGGRAVSSARKGGGPAGSAALR